MGTMMRSATLPALVGLCLANIAALPEGPGLSASHPHDAGMASDPAVLLAENFETGALSDLAKRWDDVSNENAPSWNSARINRRPAAENDRCK
jgi:hypothetical protein